MISTATRGFTSTLTGIYENQKSLLSLFAVMIVVALVGIPADAIAGTLPTVGTDGGAIASNSAGFFKKYATYIIFGFGVVIFLIASIWIVGSINDYRNKVPGAGLGQVGLMFFLAILATIFGMYLLNEALTLLNANF